jgi:hypothetical protein
MLIAIAAEVFAVSLAWYPPVIDAKEDDDQQRLDGCLTAVAENGSLSRAPSRSANAAPFRR